MTQDSPLAIGMILFDGVTQLDLTGPYEILARMPRTHVTLIAATLTPVRTEFGLTIVPDATFANAAPTDVICVPGGWGVNASCGYGKRHEVRKNGAGRARNRPTLDSDLLGSTESALSNCHWSIA